MGHDTRKPAWPYRDVVLRAHMGSGQWYKNVRGRCRYFGALADPASARQKYIRFLDGLASAREFQVRPQPRDCDLDLDFVANEFLSRRDALVTRGERSAGQFARYRSAAALVIRVLGRHMLLSAVAPHHFAMIRDEISGSAATRGNVIRDIRAMFHWAQRQYGVVPRYGDEFNRPDKRAIRAGKRPRQLWNPDEIRIMLAAAKPVTRAFILLGINCGFGQSDCASLTRESFDLVSHWMARGKTGIARRCPLWPETAAALCAFVRPFGPSELDHLFFITARGRRWVMETISRDENGAIKKTAYKDHISQDLRQLCQKCGVKYRPYYTFRHTFRSVADEVADSTAINCIMGHSSGGMREVYTQLMGDGMARLKTVTDHVHEWLFPQT